ncbi:MAG TPA: LamG-like jellyroll fold domain-containing protein, partial [Verrucomicrobiales bacterium]|nr:LamG-like jellyroll fold domain-containing protein [Verrucomicrobiales bacterium]
HKKCAFIVLFSDEGDPSGAPRDFTKPAQQKMSAKQKAWLEETLQKTKSLKHTFVFIHHPRWVKKTYPGADWDETHNLLKASGNVRAVFAGHVHRTRYDGNRDGIDYVTLATTGGSMPGNFPEAGYLHHMNIVSVRPEGIKISTLPVGTIIDPKKYTPDLIAEVEGLRAMPLGLTAAPIGLDATGRGAGLVEFKITNPAQSDLEVLVTPADEPGEWVSTAQSVQFVVKPGETKTGAFSMIRVMEGFSGKGSNPSVEFAMELIKEDGRIPLPPRKVNLPVTLKALPADFFKTDAPKALRLDGKSAVRIEMGNKKLPNGPFTVESWVLPGEGVSGDILSKAEQSEFALNLANNVPGFHAFIDERYTSAIATEALPAGKWSHVAGVFDGKAMTLYVNGKPSATVPASGKRSMNPLPLYLGANPDAKSEPTQFYTGALDEVRISSTARYAAAFTPERNFTRDDKTVYLFHCDKTAGPFFPSDSAGGGYGTFTGKPALVAP